MPPSHSFATKALSSLNCRPRPSSVCSRHLLGFSHRGFLPVACQPGRRHAPRWQAAFSSASSTSSSSSASTFSNSKATPFQSTSVYALVLLLAGGVYGTTCIVTAHADGPASDVDLTIEKPRTKAHWSKEQTREVISSQHVQVKQSWENPGVYAWGSNSGRVVDPTSDDTFVKDPRRIAFFNGSVLRDLKLDRTFAAAVDERGDLYQWGTGYAPDVHNPVRTLTGKNLVSVTLSRDRILALASSGAVYSLPVARQDQLEGPKLQDSSWFPFWSSGPALSYRTIQPKLSYFERITSIVSGLDHALLLTSSGRVFAAAASTNVFPSRGQLGIPGLTWNTRPPGPYDQPHELATLQGFTIKAVAAGDYHSLAMDSEGRIFAFGDNAVGQLGQDPTAEVAYIDAPSLVSTSRLYAGTGQKPLVTGIFAGGLNSYFTVDAQRVAQPGDDPLRAQLGRVTADTWSCGEGIRGQLGTGRWTHVQGRPRKIKALSGLFEYDEVASQVIPIRLAYVAAGSTHAAAVMANLTYLGANARSSANDTNWGADVVWWGGNEYYQLGSGKRNNSALPIYIGPLEPGEDGKRDPHRFHLTPRKTVRLQGRCVSLEQRIICGNSVSAVYSGV